MTGRVTVVGAGVVGLSCAVRLAEAGLEVNVLARDLPAETTSAVSGGLWLPEPPPAGSEPASGRASGPSDDVRRWALDSLAELVRLAVPTDPANGPDHGVRIMPGTLLQRGGPVRRPAWTRHISALGTPSAVQRPAPGYAAGLRLSLPLVHLPGYLGYLTGRLRAAGGTLTRLPLSALPARGVVVNCSGVAARALVPDRSVRAVRSQVALLGDPGLRQWWYGDDPDGPSYVLPHGTEVVVGATLGDGDWGTAPDDAAGRRLVERAREIVPALRDAAVLGHRVGLRPARPSVRLDVERRPTPDDPDHVRIHCYGHGGHGVTLAWGCAGDVTGLVTGLAARS